MPSSYHDSLLHYQEQVRAPAWPRIPAGASLGNVSTFLYSIAHHKVRSLDSLVRAWLSLGWPCGTTAVQHHGCPPRSSLEAPPAMNSTLCPVEETKPVFPKYQSCRRQGPHSTQRSQDRGPQLSLLEKERALLFESL